MKIFFYFLFVLFFINLVSASLNLDKGRLDYNIEVGEEKCQIIKISSPSYNGKILIRDIWAENPNEESNFRKYIFTSEDHGLKINYENEIMGFEEEYPLKVCLKGQEIGEYKGAIIFTPYSNTNVVVEVGTWLFVTITEPQPEPTTPPTNQQPASGGGGGGGSYSMSQTEENESSQNATAPAHETISTTAGESETPTAVVVEKESEKEEDASGITGAAIAQNPIQTKAVWGAIIIFVAFAITIAAFIIKKRKQA